MSAINTEQYKKNIIQLFKLPIRLDVGNTEYEDQVAIFHIQPEKKYLDRLRRCLKKIGCKITGYTKLDSIGREDCPPYYWVDTDMCADEFDEATEIFSEWCKSKGVEEKDRGIFGYTTTTGGEPMTRREWLKQ